MVHDIEDDDVLVVLPEDYGMPSEAWCSFLSNFKSAEVYDKQLKVFLNWYFIR